MNIITRTLVATAFLGASVIGLASVAAQSADGPRRGHDRGDRMERMLERTDTNGDGAIDAAEFAAEAEARFTQADADGDGLVTEAEREAAHEAMHAERRERAIEAFGEDRVAEWEDRHGDRGPRGEHGPSGDGEARGDRGPRGEHGPHGRGDRFAEADRNGDGAIDRVELDEHVAERFAHMDATGDGVLDASDRDAHHERMRECMRGE